MLLTGFDAPIEQVMYLDSPLKEHTLLQAIARVNRTADHKDYGLIVDYWGVSEALFVAYTTGTVRAVSCSTAYGTAADPRRTTPSRSHTTPA